MEGDGSQKFSCPDGTEAKLEPIDIRAGRIKITISRVGKSMRTLEKRYPGGHAPKKFIARYDRLAKRGRRLVKAYNAAIDEHNAVIRYDCEPD